MTMERFVFKPVHKTGTEDGWVVREMTGESVQVEAKEGRVVDLLREAIRGYVGLISENPR